MMLKSILTQLAWTASMKLSTIIKENNLERLDDERKMQHKYIFIFILPLWDLAWDTCKNLPGFVGGLYLKGKQDANVLIWPPKADTQKNRSATTYLCLVDDALISCLLIPISEVYF